MSDDACVPELMLVRVLTASHPFEAGDVLSLAFNEAAVGRLVPHERRAPFVPAGSAASLVPDTVSVRVLTDATPYASGATVTLSFVDPRFARIHAPSHETTEVSQRTDAPSLETSGPATARNDGRITLAIDWTFERARRFVSVIDKLFTIERLGAYRHVLAMRLLVPDTIACVDAATTVELARRLHALRSAVTETLGRPLLAAFMPAFTVDREWIETIENPAVESAARDLRSAIRAHAIDDSDRLAGPPNATASSSVATISARDLGGGQGATSAALIARLVPSIAVDHTFTNSLDDYRSMLVAAFSGTRAPDTLADELTPEVYRGLDERLWHLAGTVGATFGGVAVA